MKYYILAYGGGCDAGDCWRNDMVFDTEHEAKAFAEWLMKDRSYDFSITIIEGREIFHEHSN